MEIVWNYFFVVCKCRRERRRCPLKAAFSELFVIMKKYLIHKNLNTSFVNLPALVRHLRSLQFSGSIHIELSSYEADIEFTGSSTMRACEQDHVAGRISRGEQALQRILIRAQEPGGLIHVYRDMASKSSQKIFVDRSIVAGANSAITRTADTPVRRFGNANAVLKQLKRQSLGAPIPKPEVILQEPENWSELLSLVSELLQTVDETLARSNFNFAEAFRNACGFVAVEHPFLDPDSDVFSYSDGFISVRQRLSSQDFTAGIILALARVVERLREDSYFGNVYHQTMHRLRVLANRRKLQFEKFAITNQLERVIGV